MNTFMLVAFVPTMSWRGENASFVAVSIPQFKQSKQETCFMGEEREVHGTCVPAVDCSDCNYISKLHS